MLGIWAHPDDTAFLSAGLMAEYRRRGDRVVLVTATLGEHGANDSHVAADKLAVVRHAELRDSLGILGPDGMTGRPDHRA